MFDAEKYDDVELDGNDVEERVAEIEPETETELETEIKKLQSSRK